MALVRSTRFLLSLILIVLVTTSCGGTKSIVHGLDERDANDILVFLDNKGIKAYKVKSAEEGGGGQRGTLWDVVVSPENEKEAMALLNAAGLPRRRGQNLLNIFQKSGLVPSEMEEKIRYQAGLAETIASTIRKIDGVIDTDVQLSFPEEDPLNPDKLKGDVTASVYVKHTGVLNDPNTQLITKIRRLVASSVQGLKFDNVTVIPDLARFSDLSLRTTQAQRAQERDWVRVWTLTVAKESKTRFQLIFFTFLLLILLTGLSLGWILWKVFPLIPSGGGLKKYFDMSRFGNGEKEEEPAKEEKAEEEAPLEEEAEEPAEPEIESGVEPSLEESEAIEDAPPAEGAPPTEEPPQ